MSKIQDHDIERAQAFFAGPDATELLEKYEDEFDAELREDWVKAAMYMLYRESGLDVFYANLNACRRAPGASNSDRHFNEKARRRMNNMSEVNRDNILRLARRAGVNTQGKFYVGGLGRYTDQKAWVSTADDAIASAKAQRKNLSGAVKYKSDPVEGPRQVGGKLAPDIMQRQVKKLLQSEPATAEKVRKNPKKLQEVKERVLAKHAPPKRTL